MFFSMQKTSDILWQDAQHQTLFAILELIAQPESGIDAVRHLHDYAESHFALEEHYMTALAYPERETHVAAHNQFREEIASLLAQNEDDAGFRALVATFLTEWLRRHVFGVDKALEAFILASERK